MTEKRNAGDADLIQPQMNAGAAVGDQERVYLR
jgi:hypothetical protein